MKNMKVSKKLMAGFSTLILFVLIISAGGIYGLFRMSGISDDMYQVKALPLGNLTAATEYFQRLRVYIRDAIIYTGNTEKLSSIDTDMRRYVGQFKDVMGEYGETIATETGRALHSSITNQFNNTFEPGILKVMEGAKRGDNPETLLTLMVDTTVSANAIADEISKLSQARLDVMKTANDESTRVKDLILFCDTIVITTAVLVSMLIAFYISSIISKPLTLLTRFMQRAGTTGDITPSQDEMEAINTYSRYNDETGQCIASTAVFVERIRTISGELERVSGGDLTLEIRPLSSKDVIGNAVKDMTEGLNDIFGNISAATAQVAYGSKQVSDGAQVLSQGATEQAAAVEQLSESISGITKSTDENANMAAKAAGLANTIKNNAERGNHQMDNMMDAVREINQASQSINKVIKVIDDIAFQTNILALNAAVEAARAGQHGKGFAVVAEEVRNLAAKSAEAAKDTSGLIANSIEKAELGARIADETAASLTEIVSGINQSTEIVVEIARSSGQQAESISHLNKGIEQVAHVIQQNSATAEQSSATSQEMSGQAAMLEQMISKFKLKNVAIGSSSSVPSIDLTGNSNSQA